MSGLEPAAVAEVCAGVPGLAGCEVETLERLSGGASRETWAVGLSVAGEPRRVVLQRERAGATVSTLPTGVAASLISAADGVGVPVPAVLSHGAGNGDGIGTPWLLMSYVDGETIPRKILRDGRFAQARSRLVRQCAEALAAVHRIVPATVPGVPRQDPLETVRTLLALMDEPHPAFELAIRWLDQNRPVARSESVVHGDFRLGNLIVDDDGLRAVIDWELAHLGDPVEDLGWLCVKSWRFGGSGVVAGLADYSDLIGAYGVAGGALVDPDELRWWEVLGTVRWGAISMLQAHAHLSGATRSVELATIGRRVCESEHDVLKILP